MSATARMWRTALAAGLALACARALAAELEPVSPSAAVTASVATNLTLTSAVELAVRDNAELKSLRAKWEAMRERPAQAGALANPMLTYGGMDMASGGAWPDTNEKRLMVEQEFPWLGKRGLRAGIAEKEAEAMQRELEAMTLEVVMRVKETYFDLRAIQRALAIVGDEGEVLRRMAKIAETMYASGERPQQDALKAQAEVTLLKQKLLELKARETTLKARLNTLLNRRADAPLGEAVSPPEPGPVGDLEQSFATAATNRPEVRMAQAQVERYELETKLMAKEVVPDYRLGLEYRTFDDSDDMVMFTVGLDLPIWRSKYRAGVREAEKMAASSRAALASAERESAFDVQDASFNLMTARRTLDLYRAELIPQAVARLASSEAGYRAGKVDFMDYLESERFLLEVRTMQAMTEGAVGMQAARLERAVGTAAPGEEKTR